MFRCWHFLLASSITASDSSSDNHQMEMLQCMTRLNNIVIIITISSSSIIINNINALNIDVVFVITIMIIIIVVVVSNAILYGQVWQSIAFCSTRAILNCLLYIIEFANFIFYIFLFIYIFHHLQTSAVSLVSSILCSMKRVLQ